jgi:hypothetical protein
MSYDVCVCALSSCLTLKEYAELRSRFYTRGHITSVFCPALTVCSKYTSTCNLKLIHVSFFQYFKIAGSVELWLSVPNARLPTSEAASGRLDLKAVNTAVQTKTSIVVVKLYFWLQSS